MTAGRVPLASGAQFIAVRRDTLAHLAPPDGERRTSRALAALVVGIMVSLEAPWRPGPNRGRLDPWPMVAWGGALGMPWRRVRTAADRLAAAGLATTTSAPFQGSTIVAERDHWVHNRQVHGDNDNHAMLSPAAVDALAEEHDLTWHELGVLLALLLLVDTRDWTVQGWTLKRLAARLGVGHRTLVATLDSLAERDLVRWSACRGHACRLVVPVGPALIVPPRSDGRLLPRDERRDLSRQAERGRGPAVGLAGRLLAHHELTIPPSPALLSELAELIGRLDTGVAFDHLAAMGGLAKATDPIAVLVHRVRRLIEHQDHAAAAAAEKRRRTAEGIKAQQDALAGANAINETQVAEGRWVAQVLDDQALAEMVRLYRVTNPRRLGVGTAAMVPAITDAARHAVATHPDIDPAAAARQFSLAALSGHLSAPGEPAATTQLPLGRAGPKLTERLRSLDRY